MYWLILSYVLFLQFRPMSLKSSIVVCYNIIKLTNIVSKAYVRTCVWYLHPGYGDTSSHVTVMTSVGRKPESSTSRSTVLNTQASRLFTGWFAEYRQKWPRYTTPSVQRKSISVQNGAITEYGHWFGFQHKRGL